MTSAGGLVPAPTRGRAAGRAAAVGPGRRRAGRRRPRPSPTASPTPSPSTWAARRTDVCLVLGGRPAPAAERDVAGLPVRLPSLDVHTIGAGGGSIARLDDGGALVVGPRERRRRARARPATAAAATEPTVTDADLVAGRIPAGRRVPGSGRARPRRRPVGARRERASTADGVVAVVDAAMEQAIRVVSVERGVDPRGLALVAFGGAGPLHACALAEALGMAAVIVPGPGRRAVGRRHPRRAAAGRPCGPTDPLDHAAAGRPPTSRVGQAAEPVLAGGGADEPGGELVGGRRRPASRSSTTRLRLPLRRPEPRAARAPTRRRSTASTTAATATPGPATRWRSCAVRAAGPARVPGRRRRTCPCRRRERAADRARAWSPSPTAPIWVPDGWVAEPGCAPARWCSPTRATGA